MSKLHLLLIGGGEIGAPKSDGTFRPLETFSIDEHFVRSLNKDHPHILFIPTATEQMDPNRLYEQGIKSLYSNKLGCSVDTLYFSDQPSKKEIKAKLQNDDALYIGGGDTDYMIAQWKKFGFDKLLKEKAIEGKPIAGISAGAMCWFEKMLTEKPDGMEFIDGFSLLKYFLVPHWNKYQKFLDPSIIKQKSFIALDNCCALEINGFDYHIIKSDPKANLYLINLGPDVQSILA